MEDNSSLLQRKIVKGQGIVHIYNCNIIKVDFVFKKLSSTRKSLSGLSQAYGTCLGEVHGIIGSKVVW